MRPLLPRIGKSACLQGNALESRMDESARIWGLVGRKPEDVTSVNQSAADGSLPLYFVKTQPWEAHGVVFTDGKCAVPAGSLGAGSDWRKALPADIANLGLPMLKKCREACVPLRRCLSPRLTLRGRRARKPR